MKTFTLTKIFRQENPIEGALLSRIREGKQTDLDLSVLNQRVRDTPSRGSTIVTPYRRIVQNMNELSLSALDTDLYEFHPKKTGNKRDKDPDSEDFLHLKPGCRVIIKSNDRRKIKGYMQEVVNGDTGTFLGVDKYDRLIIYSDRHKDEVYIKQKKTETIGQYIEDGERKEKILGTVTQYPVILGYAMTMHSAQGCTLSRIHVQLTADKPFAPGLLYVALSRVKSFQGLTLSRNIRHSDILPPKGVSGTGNQQYEFTTKDS